MFLLFLNQSERRPQHLLFRPWIPPQHHQTSRLPLWMADLKEGHRNHRNVVGMGKNIAA
jgi:hypothetical protein